jgi:c(7)-type cytochrome triheme protein
MARCSLRAKTAVAALLVALGLAGAGVAWAAGSPGPGALIYRGGGQGKVIFDHGLHAARGYVCLDCHTDYAGTGKQLFQTRKQGLIDQATHDRDASCFACHNGAVAPKTCDTCHRGQ